MKGQGARARQSRGESGGGEATIEARGDGDDPLEIRRKTDGVVDGAEAVDDVPGLCG